MARKKPGADRISRAELHQDVADIRLDSGFTEEELAGDFAVGQTAGNVDENLGLAARQVGECGPRTLRRSAR
jgi:hypothetical protein